MIVKLLHEKGLRSDHAYTVACLAIGLSVASWVTSMKVEPLGVDRADRWGIFVATWPATWFGLGAALEQYERAETAGPIASTFGDG
ncbi:hypothetical protein [Streptomyces sp. NBC_00344]|uniref:hypothetical protein n=1 Tax=Streptomyces sp. NBC_00344 TaxID=2975720 RepID=UPI002E222064